jgi:hypothetical protein
VVAGKPPNLFHLEETRRRVQDDWENAQAGISGNTMLHLVKFKTVQAAAERSLCEVSRRPDQVGPVDPDFGSRSKSGENPEVADGLGRDRSWVRAEADPSTTRSRRPNTFGSLGNLSLSRSVTTSTSAEDALQQSGTRGDTAAQSRASASASDGFLGSHRVRLI